MLDKLCEVLPCCKGVKINLISVRLDRTNAKNHAECEKVAILNVISKFDSNHVIMEIFS